MAIRKKDDMPAVKLGRKCKACGKEFILSHPNAPNLLCEKCQAVLSKMIMERRRNEE